MKAKKSKTQLVKEHLLSHNQINTWEAIKNYKATRLSGIIYILRGKGMNIKSVPLNLKDGSGAVIKYVNYVFIKNQIITKKQKQNEVF
jgi:hypothetical protein